MNEGNGWKSRKFVLALIIVVAGCLAAFVLPIFGPFAWLRQHSVAIFAAACSLAAAYIAGNAVMNRWHAYEKFGDSRLDAPAGDPEDGA